MDLNQLSPFPEWEDEKYDLDEGEAWKSALKNELAKKLYNQWLQVYVLIESLCENLHLPPNTGATAVSENYLEHLKRTVIADATIIPSKISGAEAGDLYVLRMENASIIRKTAMDVQVQCSAFRIMGVGKNDEIDAVLKEIDIFRQHFIEWVSSFEADEFEDEWGLF